MKNPKAGDRVIVKYDNVYRDRKGKIDSFSKDGWCWLILDKDFGKRVFHISQLGRLRPKFYRKYKVGDRVRIKHSNIKGYIINILTRRDKRINSDSFPTCCVKDDMGHTYYYAQEHLILLTKKHKVKPPEFIYCNLYTKNYVGPGHLTIKDAKNFTEQLMTLKYKLIEVIPVENK